MDTKRYVIIALGALGFTVNAHAEVNAGIIRLNEGGPNYLYTSKKIGAGDAIHFQFPKNDHPACCQQIKWKAAQLLAPDPDAVDQRAGRPLYRYRVLAPGASPSLAFIGIAVIGHNVSVEQDDAGTIKSHTGQVTSDLVLCTSQEGVHLTSSNGPEETSHLYLYLGYDIENPTCASDSRKSASK